MFSDELKQAAIDQARQSLKAYSGTDITEAEALLVVAIYCGFLETPELWQTLMPRQKDLAP